MTRDQEAYCIQVLLACPTVTAAAQLLGLSYDMVHHVRQRAVQRGLVRRDTSLVTRLCIDDKSFLRGSSFVTVLSALDQGCVLEVVPERTKQAAVDAVQSLPEPVRQQITAVAQDMWDPYQRAVEQVLPKAAIVHDRFHITKHLNDAVNKVRRAEHAELKAKGDLTLSGQRFVFLKNPQNWSATEADAFEAMQHMELKVSRAWRLKELFGQLYSYQSETWARKFFARWFASATHSRLPLLSKVAWMIKKRLDHVVSYAKHRITNAVAEGLNSKIQSIKAAARGFRNFDHYRIAILFHCGGLQLTP
jgi:transposase